MNNEKREQELRAQQLILEAFVARLAGEKDYSLEVQKLDQQVDRGLQGVKVEKTTHSSGQRP